MKRLVFWLFSLACVAALAQQFPKAHIADQVPLEGQPKQVPNRDVPRGSPLQKPGGDLWNPSVSALDAHATAIKMLSKRIDALEDRIKQLEERRK